MPPDGPALWSLANEAVGAALARLQKAPGSEPDAGVGHLAFLSLLVLLAAEPATRTSAELQDEIAFYTAERTFLDRLAAATEAGYLRQMADSSFAMGAEGRSRVERHLHQAAVGFAAVDPLSPADSTRLADLYRQVAEAAVAVLPPAGSFGASMAALIRPEWPPLAQTVRCHLCVMSCRSDLHRVAWQPSGLGPVPMTILTQLWQAGTDSEDGIVQSLARRGHSESAAREAIDTLRRGDWLAGPQAEIQITEDGRELRQSVEAETDRLFFSAWTALPDSGRDELAELLTRLAGSGTARPAP